MIIDIIRVFFAQQENKRQSSKACLTTTITNRKSELILIVREKNIDVFKHFLLFFFILSLSGVQYTYFSLLDIIEKQKAKNNVKIRRDREQKKGNLLCGKSSIELKIYKLVSVN